MPQEILRQVNFNGGELDPKMHGRRDVKTYYTMLEAAQNLVTPPGGGIERRPATNFVDYVRRQMAAIDLISTMILPGNGGEAAALTEEDANVFETGQPLGDLDHLLFTIDFGAPVRVSAVDLIDYAVVDAVAPAAVVEAPFQYPYEAPIFEGPLFPGIDIPGVSLP